MPITVLIGGIVFFIALITIVLLFPGSKKNKKGNSQYDFQVFGKKKTLHFYNPFEGFLVLGGAGSGKTKSIGKQLLREYIRNAFAGFIYDFKDYDLTKTACHLVKKYDYPHEFYFINFVNLSSTHRFNPIKPSVIPSESIFIQVMDDWLTAYIGQSKKDIWYNGALGILRGVAINFYKKFPKYCTLPHIANYICLADEEMLTGFLQSTDDSRRLGGAYLAATNEDTRSSYLSNLKNYLSVFANNKEVTYVLTGDDFDFNLIDPQKPKLVSVANSFAIQGLISPVISLMLTLSSKRFSIDNKVPFFYFLDEATTFKIHDFENMPSVLREFLCSITLLTQSTSKIQKLYSKEDLASILSNLANQFFGRTKDPEALKSYPIIFGKEEKEKVSHSSGSNTGGTNRSQTTSTHKEERYDSRFFSTLNVGEFIGTTGLSNVDDFHFQFKEYEDAAIEKNLPLIKSVLPIDVDNNFEKMVKDLIFIH